MEKRVALMGKERERTVRNDCNYLYDKGTKLKQISTGNLCKGVDMYTAPLLNGDPLQFPISVTVS